MVRVQTVHKTAASKSKGKCNNNFKAYNVSPVAKKATKAVTQTSAKSKSTPVVFFVVVVVVVVVAKKCRYI